MLFILQISRQYNEILRQLIDINFLLSIGSSAVIALIYNSKLYICNIGNCRALLCKTDENNVLRVIQLSVDHNIGNEEEKQRICKLGLDPQALKQGIPHHVNSPADLYINCCIESTARSVSQHAMYRLLHRESRL